MAYPPHSLSEPNPVTLPGGRLLVYARKSNADGMPGAKCVSTDGGKTWQFQELPIRSRAAHAPSCFATGG